MDRIDDRDVVLEPLPHRLVVEEFTYPMDLARDALPARKY